MATQYALFNADIIGNAANPRPSECKIGTVVTLKKAVNACEFSRVNSPKKIPAGKYKVVNRKFFRAGYHVVEAV